MAQTPWTPQTLATLFPLLSHAVLTHPTLRRNRRYDAMDAIDAMDATDAIDATDPTALTDTTQAW